MGTAKNKTKPATDKSAEKNPVGENPAVNPAAENPAVNPAADKPAAKPATKKPEVNPDAKKPETKKPETVSNRASHLFKKMDVTTLYENSKGEFFTDRSYAVASENGNPEKVKTHQNN